MAVEVWFKLTVFCNHFYFACFFVILVISDGVRYAQIKQTNEQQIKNKKILVPVFSLQVQNLAYF